MDASQAEPLVSIDPPSGAFTAPVRVTLIAPALHAPLLASEPRVSFREPLVAGPVDADVAALQPPSGSFLVSIEHVDRVEDVFEATDPSKTKQPPSRSVFVYTGPFRITRAGRMRVCVWPASGSYERDRAVAVYFVDNPHDAATSRGWIVDKAPPSSITHPLTSFAPFSFELSAPQRYLRPAAGLTSAPGSTTMSVVAPFEETVPVLALPATLHMAWNYDRQSQSREQQQNHGARGQSPQAIATAVFAAQTTVNAEVGTTWEWIKNARWSCDVAESLEARHCIRVSKEGGMTKTAGLHGEWDAAVTTEAALPVPMQLDVIPLGAVNAVVGVHGEELMTPTGRSWRDMDVSLHLASLSGSGAGSNPHMEGGDSHEDEPVIMFRFFAHHPAPTAVRAPLIEARVAARSVLSIRIVPDSGGMAKQFCEARLLLDGQYLVSAFFPTRSAVRTSCLLSDPVAYPALQIVPRAPTTHIRVHNVFFGAAPLGSTLDQRRLLLQRQIAFELEHARASTRGRTDPAHADPQCSVLFVDLRLDISLIEALPGIESAAVPLAMYWRPTWLQTVPLWTLKTLSNASQSLLKLFALESGRCVESFEEAHDKNSKESSILMQM